MMPPNLDRLSEFLASKLQPLEEQPGLIEVMYEALRDYKEKCYGI